jgi:hypothetical protein
MKLIETKSKLALTFILLLCTTAIQAQRIWIPNIEIQEGDTIVDVPIYLTVTDSLTSIQLSVLWPSEELKLDTLIFAPHLYSSDDPMMTYSVLSEQEMRTVITNSSAGVTPDPFASDSLLLTIRFQITDKFTGAVDIVFNPDFQNFLVHFDVYPVFPELEGGGVSSSSSTTSLWGNSSQPYTISLSPNPVTHTYNLLTEKPELKNAVYQLIDAMGRKVDRGTLTNGQGEVPNHLPNGTYFLTLHEGNNQITTRLIIKR